MRPFDFFEAGRAIKHVVKCIGYSEPIERSEPDHPVVDSRPGNATEGAEPGGRAGQEDRRAQG